jgi:hypothetical protein
LDKLSAYLTIIHFAYRIIALFSSSARELISNDLAELKVIKIAAHANAKVKLSQLYSYCSYYSEL